MCWFVGQLWDMVVFVLICWSVVGLLVCVGQHCVCVGLWDMVVFVLVCWSVVGQHCVCGSVVG